MDPPSRLSTSLCLLNSVFDKSTWLRDREITEPWPVAGLPEILHVDNGADFRSRAEDERALRPDGIHLFGLRYWSPALSGPVRWGLPEARTTPNGTQR